MPKRFALLALAAALCGAAAGARKSEARPDANMPGAYAVAFGGVTNIKEVVNNTSGIVTVRKLEYTGNIFTDRKETTKRIPAGGVWSGEMWVPWANDADEFINHRMRIDIQNLRASGSNSYVIKRFYVWQSGEYLRFTDRESYVDNAPKVPGEARAGGERRLVVGGNGDKVVFKFEKYTE